MQVQEIKLPKLGLGWLQDMVLQRDKYAFTLPPGKILVVTPTINVLHTDYLALGVPQINCNDGQNQAGVPRGQKAVMAGRNFIQAVGKPIRDFNEGEIQQAIDNAVLGGAGAGVGYAVFTSQVGERTLNEDGTPSADNIYCYDYDSPKTLTIRQGIAAKIRQLGGEMFDEYDGHNLIDSQIAGGGVGQFRPFLQTNQAAYNYLHATPMGFHSHAYWLNDEYQWRGGIIQTYWNLDLAYGKFYVFAKHLAFHLDIMAKLHVGTSSPTIAFGFPAGTDFANHSGVYQRPVAGGVMQGTHQPKYSPTDCIIVHLIALIMAKGAFGWQTTQVDGQDPAILLPDSEPYEANGVPQLPRQRYIGSGNPTRLGSGNGAIGTQTNAYGYPANPHGYDDLVVIAGYLYGKGYMHTGSAQWTYGQVKRSDGSFPAVVWNTYPLDQYEAQAGISFLVGTGSKRTIYFYNSHRSAGVFAEETVRVDGQDFTFQAEGHVPYCFNIQL